jgi:hypothetical protein
VVQSEDLRGESRERSVSRPDRLEGFVSAVLLMLLGTASALGAALTAPPLPRGGQLIHALVSGFCAAGMAFVAVEAARWARGRWRSRP